MQLLQGGTQSDLRRDGEFVVPVSEQGASIYVTTTDMAKGYCSLANTVSADLTAQGLYICTATQIYFLALEDIDGDSTSSLQLLSITPPNNIIKLCAERTFIAFISTQDISLVNLSSMTLRSLSVANLAYLATYRTYVAFATASTVYTFCTKADTLSLANCYTPCTLSTSNTGFTLIDSFYDKIKAVSENILYKRGVTGSNYSASYSQYFGSYKRCIRMLLNYATRYIFYGWDGFDCRNGWLEYMALDGPNMSWEANLIDPSVVPIQERPGYYKDNADVYKLDRNCAVKDLAVHRVTGEYTDRIEANGLQDIEPNGAIFATTYDSEGEVTYHFFTIPDESRDSFKEQQVVGQIYTATKLYAWVTYYRHKDGDPEDTWTEPRTVFCVYDRAATTTTCTLDTFRSTTTNLLPESTSTNKSYYFSDVIPYGTGYLVADKETDNANWLSSGECRKLKYFTLDTATDTLTSVFTYSVIQTHDELDNCYIVVSETLVAVYFSNSYCSILTPIDTNQLTYSITALALGPGLAIADNGTGIHYMGLTGHWKRLFTETEQIKDMDIGCISMSGDKLGYTTNSYSKVIDV